MKPEQTAELLVTCYWAKAVVDSGSAIEYHYTVTFGGRIFGVVDFLLALGTEAPALGADGQVRKIHANSESITIADAASITKYSGNSQWVPTGAQAGKWNLSQWN